MRNVFTTAVLLALSIAVSAQRSDLHADANPAAEGEIKALQSRLTELVIRADWDEYAKYLSSDYLHTRENGQVESKDVTLAGLRDVKRKIIVMEMEPATLAIRVYGDTAVSIAEFTIRVRDSGQVKSRRTRRSDVFVKRDSQWWLTTEHDSAIGK